MQQIHRFDEYICMKNVLIFLGILCLCWACQTSSSEKQTSSTTEMTRPSTDQTIFAQHFNSDEIKAMLAIKETFEEGICKGREAKDVSACYSFHAWIVRSDFFQKNPLTKNFPYNGEFQLDKAHAKTLNGIWTDKCGFQSETETINYFCVDANAKVMDYFDVLGKNAPTIQRYTDIYREKKTHTPQELESMLISMVDEFDYANFDHQVFHLLFHSSLNEELRAANRLQAQR